MSNNLSITKCDLWTVSRVWLKSGGPARFFCGSLLIVAALLKLYEVATDLSLAILNRSLMQQVLSIEVELLLGAWLFSNRAATWSRRAATCTFLAFGCYSFYLTAVGAESCNCFGKAHVSPAITFGLDFASIVLLSHWRPSRENAPWLQYSRYTIAMAAIAFVVVFVSSIAIASNIRSAAQLVDGVTTTDTGVFLEPDQWIGKPFPLFDDINLGDELRDGFWTLVFYNRTCSACQKALFTYLATQADFGRSGSIVLVEIPPYNESSGPYAPRVRDGKLSDSRNWMMRIPVEVRLSHGKVTGVRNLNEGVN